MKIKYQSSVKVAAGWRSVNIVADVEKLNEAIAIVKNVILIDGETPAYSQSRTGAKRQEFNGIFWAKTQIGAKKRLSSCTILNEVTA